MGHTLTAPMMDMRCNFKHIGNENPTVRATEDWEDILNRKRANGSIVKQKPLKVQETHYGYCATENDNWRARNNAKPLTVTRSKAK